MHLGAITSVFIDLPLKDVARKIRQMGVGSIEIGTGGYYPKTHCDPAALLRDESALAGFRNTLSEAELTISAFAVHGEPLHPDPSIAEAYDRDFRDICRLAEKLGVTRLTLLSGLPEAAPGDRMPNWILYPFPSYYMEQHRWQWEERLVPYWREHGKVAEDHGIRLCFEMHPGDMVFHPEALLRLRDDVGPVIGCNLDPSHLFWQGMDIIEVVRTLGEAIYHVHAKDSGTNGHNVRTNGYLAFKDFRAVAERGWLFRTVGYGHGEGFWRDFVTALRLVGYDDVLSIEHEDPLMDPEEGFERAVVLLKGVLMHKPATKVWFE